MIVSTESDIKKETDLGVARVDPRGAIGGRMASAAVAAQDAERHLHPPQLGRPPSVDAKPFRADPLGSRPVSSHFLRKKDEREGGEKKRERELGSSILMADKISSRRIVKLFFFRAKTNLLGFLHNKGDQGRTREKNRFCAKAAASLSLCFSLQWRARSPLEALPRPF